MEAFFKLDSQVRIWCRESGEELLALSHHTYIVWSVQVSFLLQVFNIHLHFHIQLCGRQLVTASYDCTVVVSTLPSSLLQEMASSSTSNPLKCVTEEEVKQVSKVQVQNMIISFPDVICFLATRVRGSGQTARRTVP